MLLKEGDTGATVASLQRGLMMMCCDPNGLDGIFGPGCTAAVKKWQGLQGLEQTGIVDDTTWGHLVLEITEIQYILIAKGYDTGGHDGKAGPKTYNAILQFQKDNNLTADGMVGNATWDALMASMPEENTFPLKMGSRGSYVTILQYGLRIMCCSPGSYDGVFGTRTRSAVIKYQKKYGLTADGIVGTNTWDKLREQIREIQQALIDKNYASFIADGLAGIKTYNAIISFQKANGLSTDGQVGPATREKLLGNANDGTPEGFPLKKGATGEIVRCLQRGLRIAIINCEITGTFDDQTFESVKKFQSRNGLSADGIVGVKTWEKMCANVRKYQNALNNQGYDVGDEDGIAGERTYNAILKFQKDKGLEADGMCGTKTQVALFGASTGGGTTSATLKLGSSGSLTRYLQIMMNTMGYSLTVDGIFGDNMNNAVKDYQAKKGLTADGIVGSGTWGKLFADYKIDANGTGVFKMLNIARHELEIGFKEDNANNITPYGIRQGHPNGWWCAMFVCWCAHYAGVENLIPPDYKSCRVGKAWYESNKRYHKRTSDYQPKAGDIIFFWRINEEGQRYIGHTGIVEYFDKENNKVRTIEGNANEGVMTRTYNMSDADIDGFGDNGGTNTRCGGADYKNITHHRLSYNERTGYYGCLDCGYTIPSPALEEAKVLRNEPEARAKIAGLWLAYCYYATLRRLSDPNDCPLGKPDPVVPSRGSYYLPEKILYYIDKERRLVQRKLGKGNGYQYQGANGEFINEYDKEYAHLHLTDDMPIPAISYGAVKLTETNLYIYNGTLETFIKYLLNMFSALYFPAYFTAIYTALQSLQLADKDANLEDAISYMMGIAAMVLPQLEASSLLMDGWFGTDFDMIPGDYYVYVREAITTDKQFKAVFTFSKDWVNKKISFDKSAVAIGG